MGPFVLGEYKIQCKVIAGHDMAVITKDGELIEEAEMNSDIISIAPRERIVRLIEMAGDIIKRHRAEQEKKNLTLL